METIKQEEIMRYKNMSPEQRIAAAISHNKLIKEICFAGLSKKGFSKEEINRIYQGQVHE
jgi:hypothetical protein